MVNVDKITVRTKIVDNFACSYMNRTMYLIFANERQVAVFSDRILANKWANRIRKHGLKGTDAYNGYN